jgi:hypothetical protein
MASYKDQELSQVSIVLGMRERLKECYCLTREEKAAFLSASGKKDIISRQRAARNKKSAVLGR